MHVQFPLHPDQEIMRAFCKDNNTLKAFMKPLASQFCNNMKINHAPLWNNPSQPHTHDISISHSPMSSPRKIKDAAFPESGSWRVMVLDLRVCDNVTIRFEFLGFQIDGTNEGFFGIQETNSKPIP